MALEENVKNRISDLINSSTELGNVKEDSPTNATYTDIAKCEGWVSAAMNIIQRELPTNNAYRQQTEKLANEYTQFTIDRAVEGISEILKQLLKDDEAGLVYSRNDIRQQVKR